MELATMNDTALVQQGDSLAAEVQALVVTDDASFQRAADLSRNLAGWIKTAEEFFGPMKQSAHKTWRSICDREGAVINPKKALKQTLGERMAAFEQERERLRREAEEAARRDQERLEAEERARVEAENARLKKEAEDRVLEDAIAAEEAGDVQAATFLLDEPTFVPTVAPQPVFVAPVQVAAPAAKGISFTTTWSAQLVDLMALVKAAAGGNTVALSCLKFDDVRANALARSLKDNLTVPGVKAVSKRSTATRSA